MAIAYASLVSANSVQAITYPDRTTVIAGETPWLVSIWETSNSFDRSTYLCSGVLLGPRTVLTAAHCMDAVGGTGFVVVAGQDKRTDRGIVRTPHAYVQYPKYRIGDYLYDVAVIDLYEPLFATSYARLATTEETKYLLRKPTTLYGWGRNENGALPTRVRKVTQQHMSTLASKFYREFEYRTQLGAGRINSNGTFSGSCVGDAGSPLIASLNNRSTVVGLASYLPTPECNTSAPRVFTRVGWFESWIRTASTKLQNVRIQAGINVDRASYGQVGGDLIPRVTGDEEGSIFSVADVRFAQESVITPAIDISDVTVKRRDSESGQDDVEFFITMRDSSSQWVCGPQNSGYPMSSSTFSVNIGSADESRIKSLYTMTFVSQPDTCLGSTQMNMRVASNSSVVPVPDGCSASLSAISTRQLKVTTDSVCLANLERSFFRFAMLGPRDADIEPGFDAWSGPFNLTFD
jgi:V8-like Glu-specific endopeptidase